MIKRKLLFTIRSLQERLWIKPLAYAVLAALTTIAAGFADRLPFEEIVPQIEAETIEKLLTVISASMLGVATFAVASMVSAFASAGGSATPRAFFLVLSDSKSQTALSSFIGAFIFSIVGIAGVEISYFGPQGRLVLFFLTLSIFAWVIFTFVRWVDNIARLGRLANTIEKAEIATAKALSRWHNGSPLGGVPMKNNELMGVPVYSKRIGYIQHCDAEVLQDWAERNEADICIHSLPGTFISPKRPLLSVRSAAPLSPNDTTTKDIQNAFIISENRTFAEDPRFGLIVMSEIASRALSPGVNDPGTAIDIINRLTRILYEWSAACAAKNPEPEYKRLFVPGLSLDDLFEDAYAAISRDGAGIVEVGVWLQKSFSLLTQSPDAATRNIARRYSALALARAESTLTFSYDLERVRHAAEAAHMGNATHD